MAKRIKRAALPVPTSRAGADAALGRIGELQRQLDAINGHLSEEVARQKARCAEAAAPIAEEIRELFEGLHVWAEGARAELLEDGRKSVAMSQGTIGWRLGMPTVKVARGQHDAVVATLGRLGLGDLIRTRQELDKDAVLRDPDLVRDVPGLAVEQVEQFFAKPLDLEVEQAKTVARQPIEGQP